MKLSQLNVDRMLRDIGDTFQNVDHSGTKVQNETSVEIFRICSYLEKNLDSLQRETGRYDYINYSTSKIVHNNPLIGK